MCCPLSLNYSLHEVIPQQWLAWRSREQHSEALFTAGGSTLQGWGRVPQEAGQAVNQPPNSGLPLPQPGSQGPRLKGGSAGGSTLTTAHRPLTKCVLPVPSPSGSAGLEVLVPKRGVSPPGDTTIPRDWKMRWSPGHFGQQTKEMTILSDWSWQPGAMSCRDTVDRRKSVSRTQRTRKVPLSKIKPCDESQWKSTTVKSRQDANNGPDPWGVKAAVPPPGEEPRPAEVPAEGRGRTDGSWEGKLWTSNDHTPSTEMTAVTVTRISSLVWHGHVCVHAFF